VKRVLTITLLITFMLVLCGTGWSAEAAKKGTEKGFKVGLAMAKFGGDAGSPKNRMGFGFGGFIGFRVGENMMIQPELLYLMKGAKYEAGNEKLTFKVDYLEIPVLIKFCIPTKGQISPSLFVGPSVGIKLSNKIRYEEGGVSEEAKVDFAKGTDFGLVLGGGLDFAMGTGKICFDARYTLGLTNILDVDGGDWKNNVIGINFGYAF
jgi:hypothetical protein